MTYIEKAIKGLEEISDYFDIYRNEKNDYYSPAQDYYNAAEDAIALLKQREVVTEWKDARHELPDEEGYYLVFIPGEFNDTMMVARYSFNHEIPWRGAQAHSAIEDVLLWMPLPKVPKNRR